ncbi:MAG TPA: putative aminohydrolase SsnA [Anaerolineales bacterium]|nr:putative aminohydrolase SsnA [Anaerolineales bacterium]
MLITNATIVTGGKPNRVLHEHAALIVGDHIQAVGPSRELEAANPKTRRLDAAGQLLLPGAICAHTHTYSLFSRGLAIQPPLPRDLPEILQRLWWPLDAALSEEDIRLGALLSFADAIRNGTTTVFDHHASSQFVDGSLDLIADAVDRSGIRAVLCYEVTDRHGAAVTDAGIQENMRFMRRIQAQPSPRLSAMFGLHASLTLSGATLQACRAATPADKGFHVHLAEHVQDQYDSLARSGMRATDRLDKHGILGPQTIAAHCVHVDAAEISLLQQTGTWVAHQPRSNMNNGVGAAPVESMLRSGVRVCLGNDGFSDAMRQEWQAAHLLQTASGGDPRRMDPAQIMTMAMTNSSDLASNFFPGQQIGQIAPGAAADLVLVEYASPTPITEENFAWHQVFGLESGMVTTTMVAGKILMQDRKLRTLDERALAARARELAPRVWSRLQDFGRT